MKRLTVMLLASAVLWIGTFAQAQDEPPYLYYFSNTLNAFVVERADGTDSRVLGQDVRPLRNDNEFNVDWSPSGEFLAWRSYSVGSYGQSTDSLSYVIRADGTGTLPILNGVVNTSLYWSPTEDVLLAVQRRAESEDGENQRLYGRNFSLIDVTTQEVISSFYITPSYSNPISSIVWSPDGAYVAFYYDVADSPALFMLMYRDGTIEQRELSPLEDDNGLWMLNMSAQSWTVHYTPERDRLIVLNPTTREEFAVIAPIEDPDDFSEDTDAHIRWNLSGDYALIYEYLSERYETWLLSIPERTITLLGDEFRPPTQGVLYPDLGEGWSPDGRFILLRHFNRQLFTLIDHQNDERQSFEIPYAPSIYYVDDYISWSPTSDGVYISPFGNNQTALRMYNPHTEQLVDTFIDTADWGGWGLQDASFSPDGKYILPYRTNDLINTQTGSITRLPNHSQSTVEKMGALWDETGEWLLTFDSTFMSDGGGCVLGVTNLDTDIWRELGECYSAGWLPPQVDVAELPSGQPESVLLAPEAFDYDVEGVYFITPSDEFELICDEADANVRLLLREGETIYRLQYPIPCHRREGGGVFSARMSIAVSPDNSLLATADEYNNFVDIWDASTGEHLILLNTFGFELSFSEDGSRLYTRSRQAVLVWNVADILRYADRSE